MANESIRHEADLQLAVQAFITHPRILVVSDFDGTISNFTVDPAEAELDPQAFTALRKLSETANTFVAVISGRTLSDLSVKFKQIERIRLVGSHGYEFDIDKIAPLSSEQKEILKKADELVQEAILRCPGTRAEAKPHGIVFHYRGVKPVPLDEILRLRRGLQDLGSGVVRDGNMVLEYGVVTTDKGEALLRIQEQIGPTITLFIGDDFTDEAVFKKIGQTDVSIKVGGGETFARYRVKNKDEAVNLLAQIAELRTDLMRSLPWVPIDNHLFLSDLRTTALVDRNGTLSWLCTPRLDGAPLFGALVGGPTAGHFSIQAEVEGRQQYVASSLIGKTIFGAITVTDFFDCSGGRTYQRAGRSDLVRIIEGTGKVFLELAPKFNFGRVPTRLSNLESGIRIECGQQRLVLLSPGIDWTIVREGIHDVARAKLYLKDESKSLILLIGTASEELPSRSTQQILSESQKFWEVWLATLKIPKNHAELVSRSALVLRGLCYGPSGAIAAAATTSLPETIGGGRNWDYRYCWPRDASLAASALARVNAPGPAMRLLDWILDVVLSSEGEQFLAPLYTVTGRPVPGEAEVPEALGYRNSKPVRIGNLAAEQLQLDALGPIAELMRNLVRRKASLTSEHLQLAERLVALVTSRWKDADSGIWEVRGAQRHFVHSKLMCWYTVSCCAEVGKYLGTERADWIILADEIREQIEREGFSGRLNSYVAAYDLHEADTALLWIIISGFHPPEHPRSQGTLKFIVDNLFLDGCVYRYLFDDALNGQEGEFIICRCWLIECLAMMGRKGEAQDLLDQMLSRMGSLGLLAEQWDGPRNCALGNYPQAYSHLGLINAICALDNCA